MLKGAMSTIFPTLKWALLEGEMTNRIKGEKGRPRTLFSWTLKKKKKRGGS